MCPAQLVIPGLYFGISKHQQGKKTYMELFEMKLIPVKYHNKEYPDGIIPSICEIAGNIDSKELNIHPPYSLHTEYSYMKRNFDSCLLQNLDEIKSSHKNGIPQLWKSTQWSEEYAEFIIRLIGKSIPPKIIEIHPPFREYCNSYELFWERYICFYERISKHFPNTIILIENRSGTMYPGSTFLISTCTDVLSFIDFLQNKKGELGLVIDYPQLFTAEKERMGCIDVEKIVQFNTVLQLHRTAIRAIHLWGKKQNIKGRWSAHTGDLNTFFSLDNEKKSKFLRSLITTFSDEIPRYFVPEVNSTDLDLHSIIADLLDFGAIFTYSSNNEYLLSIDWENGVPHFLLSNTEGTRRIPAIGFFGISVGEKYYCIGNKHLSSYKHHGCPTHSQVSKGREKCHLCQRNDVFKYCLRCRGVPCYANHSEALIRCNLPHYVYLTYFNGTVKVGVAHSQRKLERLLEQGALYSFIIAECPNGSVARIIESKICRLGVTDRISSAKKVINIQTFDALTAHKALLDTYDYILKSSFCFDDVVHEFSFLSPPEIIDCTHLLTPIQFSHSESYQMSMSEYISTAAITSPSCDILHELKSYHGKILGFVGSIAILENGYLYDFQKIYGAEIQISVLSNENQ